MEPAVTSPDPIAHTTSLRTSAVWDSVTHIVGITVLLGTVFFNYKNDLRLPPLFVSVLIAVSISILVHRFMGGISVGSVIQTGAFRLGGSLAALVVTVLLFNPILEEQHRIPVDELISPSPQQWVPVDLRNGQALELSLEGYTAPIRTDHHTNLERLPLMIAPDGSVRSESINGIKLGRLDSRDLESLDVNATPVVEEFRPTSVLRLNDRTEYLESMGIGIFVRSFGGDHTQYTLTDSRGIPIYDGEIQVRGAEFVSIGDRNLLVAVVQVRHNAQSPEQNFAQFTVSEIRVDSSIGFPAN